MRDSSIDAGLETVRRFRIRVRMLLPMVSVNGVVDAAISPLDRGFSYGDGLFETCRCINGQIPLWSYHRERLISSAKRLMILVDEAVLQKYLDQSLSRCQSISDCVVKIQITRGVGGRGYRLPARIEPTYFIGVFAANSLESQEFRDGVAVRICDTRLGKNTGLAGIKHLNRLEHILARAEWNDEFAEGILLDIDGNVIEATVSNLFVVRDGELITPDLSAAGVAGVMRRLIIEVLGPELNLSTRITSFDLETLRTADEIFLSNSVFGIWPVIQVEAIASGFNHCVTRKLQKKLLDFIRSRPHTAS